MVHATETADAPRSQSRFRLGFGLGCLAGLVGWGLLALGFLILLLRPISSAFIPEDEPDKLADEPSSPTTPRPQPSCARSAPKSR